MKRLTIFLNVMLLAVTACDAKAIQIVTRTLPNGQNGVAYSVTLRAKFGTKPYTWTNTGALPTGLSLNASTGAITGTPTVSAAFPFVITITDNGGITNNRNFTITIAGAAVVTAVSVTTTSLPSGTNGVAYSANLQAANGTAPYVWSVPSGVVPSGLSLNASTGALTGTPTVSGTFSPTFRVTDAASANADRALAVTVATGTPTYLFSDGFENGCAVASCTGATSIATLPYFPAWTSSSCGSGGLCPTVQTAVKNSGSYAYSQQFTLCGDSGDPSCGSSHQDLNRYLTRNLSSAPTTLYAQAYLYLKSPETGGTKNGVQRKLMWIQDASGTWSAGLTLDSASNTNYFRFFVNGSSGCGVAANGTTFGIATLWDGWHKIELRTTLNTVGAIDGVAAVWVDGVQLGSNFTTANFRGSCSTGIEIFSIGRQVDRSSYNVISEYRYWDDVILNTSYIGP